MILLLCLDPIQSLPDPVFVPEPFNVVSSFFFLFSFLSFVVLDPYNPINLLLYQGYGDSNEFAMCTLGQTLIKTDSPFPSSYQVQIVSQLGMELCSQLPFMLGFCLAFLVQLFGMLSQLL